MKTMEKKTFNKAIFLFLTLALMLTPLNLGVFASEIGVTATEVTAIEALDDILIDECCIIAEASALTGEQPIMTMATNDPPPPCKHSNSICVVKQTFCNGCQTAYNIYVYNCAACGQYMFTNNPHPIGCTPP